MNRLLPSVPRDISTQKQHLNRSVHICALFGIASLLLLYLLSGFFRLIGMEQSLTAYITSSGLVTVGATFVPLLPFLKSSGGIASYFRPRRSSLRRADRALLTGFGFCACLVINFFLAILFSFLPESAPTGVLVFDGSFGTILYMGLCFALLPALCEELAYRGFIYRSLQRYGQLFAVILSSLMFGLMHNDWRSVVFASCCGFLIGCVRKTGGKLLLCILIHFANNAFSVIGTAIRIYFGHDSYTTLLYIADNLALVVMLALFFLLRRRRIRLFSFGKSPYSLSAKEKLLSVISCPAFLVFLGLTLLVKFI